MTYTEPRPGGYGPPPHAGHRPTPGERFDMAPDDPLSFPLPDPETIESRWDLEGDLARLLQTSAPASSPFDSPFDSSLGSGLGPGLGSGLDEPPERTTGSFPAARSPAHVRGRGRRRRVRFRLPTMPWLQLISLIFAALTTVIVAMLSVLGGMISYGPLRYLAAPSTSESMAAWWPLLVYGPWLVASLSVLRAALHRRGAAHSWAVVVLFSTIAVFLCVAHAPKDPPSMAVAGLPPVAALVSFHQLVRQITLTSPPRHALPRTRGADQRDKPRV
ncbi:DUF2637 domain-containing protein [Streptomyces lonegramiae]|uniref:DUF2637 domain-containing protein n=1 Tax=Streptomyces lonegramiae TaxID=3075524 RepID=A0ABU2XJV2_9ACTN|nr:DUF2637 domain-containing protein [Streptomyces sp. DSM 41529]MDT0545365.1 DUF2637 domain-containing protein [Streptomyces sp. DSM 41529]